MSMPAGQLRERVTIRAPQSGTDALGQPVTTWADVTVDVPAIVTPLRAREMSQAAAVLGAAPVVVQVRYRTDITAAMQVVWRGVAHAILGQPIDVNARRETTEMLCSAGAPAGAAS